MGLPLAASAAALPPSPRQLWPRLATILQDQAGAANLGSLAGLVRPALLDVAFNVGTASGAVAPDFVARADTPGGLEIGLLGPVTVRLSLQRVVTVSVQVDAARLVQEQFAVGGLKKPAGWTPFDVQASVSVHNPSTNFYVMGWIWAPVFYMKRALFDALKHELQDVLPDQGAEAGTAAL